MLIHQSVFLGEHRRNIYIKKINMNHLSLRSHLKALRLNESFPNGYTLTLNGPIPGKVKKLS